MKISNRHWLFRRAFLYPHNLIYYRLWKNAATKEKEKNTYLWGYVIRCAAQCPLPLAVIIHLGGQAEVSQLDLHLVVEEYVA